MRNFVQNTAIAKNIRETLKGQPTFIKVVVLLTLAVILLASIALITGLLAGATAAVFLSAPLATFAPGTRGHFLNQLPEPYRTQAFENVRTQKKAAKLNQVEDSISAAVLVTFNWGDTPQGAKYWADASVGRYTHAEPTRTRAYFYTQLPDPYRAQAFDNTREGLLKIPCYNIADALAGGFVFADTPQGHKYWSDAVEGRYQKKEPTHKKIERILWYVLFAAMAFGFIYMVGHTVEMVLSLAAVPLATPNNRNGMKLETFTKEINALRLKNKNAWYQFTGTVEGRKVEVKGFNTWLQIYRVDGVTYGGGMGSKVSQYKEELIKPFI